MHGIYRAEQSRAKAAERNGEMKASKHTVAVDDNGYSLLVLIAYAFVSRMRALFVFC